MSDSVIQVESLSKKYLLHHQHVRKRSTLRDAISDRTKSLLQLVTNPLKNSFRTSELDEEFWALKDISFQIQQGEVVGIIGQNGAGKSTLLKILSRIVEPTTGRITLNGRVASLLEVGTGFHQELSGRENIYLNGAILGMSMSEIRKKFDEIVAFSEVENFLDTPVKHYSSGMYVRLAFSVAAHLEPEILIVDEVLAVGDASFQKKCLGKMEDMTSKEGRTVLFVSHNMGAIKSLCKSACLLNKGSLVMQGSAEECVLTYLGLNHANQLKHTAHFSKPQNAPLYMTSARLFCKGSVSEYLSLGEDLSFEVSFKSESPIQIVKLGYLISSATGDRLLNANNRYQKSPQFDVAVTEGVIRCNLGQVPLMPGQYTVSFWLGHSEFDTHIMENVLLFEVIFQDIWGQGQPLPPNFSSLWWQTEYQINHASVEYLNSR
jgi:lipopolysaccharide transport system ATP-binding protein